ncbi:aldo/keto reductase [Microbacterium sediminicola]|uniref:Aldo/keto reductase n=1 Tax=Microbacterium sediminicola TaxID=415210 RepID=A0ABP4UGF0_9MICO
MQTTSIRGRLSLTRLGVGGAQLGNLGRTIDDAQSQAVVDAGWERGIRYFDTAPHYGLGLSERRLGAALAQYPRDEYVLSTKVGRLLVDTPETADQVDPGGFQVPATHRREWDFTRDGVLRSLEGSLERLGLDRVDIVYLHDPDFHWETASTEGIQALIDLREEGVVGAVGVGMNQSAMPAAFIEHTDIDVVMLAGRYTLLEQPALADLLPLAAARGVGIVNVGIYNSGLLARDRVPADATYNYLPAPPELVARANRIAEICERWGTTLPTAAMHYGLDHPAIAAVVVGCRSAAQVEDAVRRVEADVPAGLWLELASEELIPATGE